MMRTNNNIIKDRSIKVKNEPTMVEKAYRAQSHFTGRTVDGKPEGKGTYYGINGDEIRGEFTDGLAVGMAIEKKANGEVYVGEFDIGLRSGNGELTWPDGARYRGEFLLGK